LSKDAQDGNLPLNDLIISPLTEKQSGIAGTLNYSEPLIDVKQSIDDFVEGDIELKIYDSKLERLNSVELPIDLLMPFQPQIVNNSFTLETIDASVKLLFGIYTGKKSNRRDQNFVNIIG
jgi:hypothetical protein